jgi:hypothetical protein
MKSSRMSQVGGILLAAIVAAGCASGADPLIVDPGTPIGDTGTPITTFTSAASPGCPVVRDSSVLVDPTHDGGTWWFPQAATTPSGFNPDSAHQGRALANYLRGLGFTVTELGRGATMHVDSMMAYATIIRAGYYYNALHPGYSAGDVAAYKAFLACERTLVLLGEYLRDGRRDVLADSLNIPLDGIETGTISTFTAHALTTGVTTVPFIAGSVLTSEANASIQVLGRLANGKAAMGVLTSTTAKVFWIGDVNGIQQVPQPFVANLVAWGLR